MENIGLAMAIALTIAGCGDGVRESGDAGIDSGTADGAMAGTGIDSAATVYDSAVPPDACSGGTVCARECIDVTSDVRHCGGCDRPCPTPTHGRATCTTALCGIACDEGYVARGELCAPRSPLPTSDFDGDGLADVPVGASGQVAIFYARDIADSWPSTQSVHAINPGDSNFGRAISTLGDTDGDGFAELAVMERGRGYVWVFRGSAGGLNTTNPIELPGCSTVSDTCDGEELVAAGDVDGDSFRDLVVVRSTSAGGRVIETSYLFRGAAAGLSSTSSWSAPDETAHGAGDVDGDGFDDLLLYADIGRVRVIYGSDAGPSERETTLLGTYRILAVHGVGDLDGDGFDDVGLLDTSEAVPRLLVYRGTGEGIESTASAAIAISDSEPADLDPTGLAYPGDMDGDGYADVAVGVGEVTGGVPRPSHVVVYWGSEAGLVTDAPLTLERPERDAYPVSGAGDVDGNGLADLVCASRGIGEVLVIGGLPRGATVTSGRALLPSGGSFGVALGAPR